MTQNDLNALKEKVAFLEKELQHKQLTIASIHEIGKALSSELKIDRLLPLIMNEVTRLIEAERSTFYVVDHERGEIWSKIAQKAEINEIRLKIGKGIAGHVAATGEIINIKDAYNDPRFDPSTDKKTGYRTRSVLCMPIYEPVHSADDKPNILAVIQALNKKSGVFTREDEELMSSLASQIAISLVNSQLYDDLEKKVKELNLLYDIEQEASYTEQEETLYQRLIDKLVNTFQTQGGILAFYDDQAHRFRSYFAAGLKDETAKRITGDDRWGIVNYVLQNRTLYLTNAASEDALFPRNKPSDLGLEIRQVLGVPLTINNKPVGIILLFNKTNKHEIFRHEDERIMNSVSRQLSRMVEARRLREEKNKAERLAAIGNMLSTIVHDLRTPMTNIYGFVDLMAEEDDPQTRAKYSEIIIRQIQTLNNMAHDVLDFAKGKTNILPVKTAVDKLLDEFKRTFENEIRRQGFEFEVVNKAPAMIYVDPDKIIRVFMNIMKNALEAMDKGGKFSIIAQIVGDEVEFQLKDTGKGIPEEIKGRLFESFVTSGKKEGTGLGLAIVKNVVDQHKGRIEVESTPGEGTTFKIYFRKM